MFTKQKKVKNYPRKIQMSDAKLKTMKKKTAKFQKSQGTYSNCRLMLKNG